MITLTFGVNGMASLNGTIIKWNDEKGYGFIETSSPTQSVFVHYTAFGRIPRRPMVGDFVFIQQMQDDNGKKKAVKAIIQGVSPLSEPSRPSRTDNSSQKSLGSFMLVAAILIGISMWIYKKNQSPHSSDSASGLSTESSPVATQAEQFTCAGKRHCGEMTSKAEAQFYLNNCPHEGMDGDGDGSACERQFGE